MGMARVKSMIKLPDFRKLFAGVMTSHLGDQFALIATPWLALQMTNDPKILGAVLAIGGIPRAILMILGGAATDRFSPRLVMLISDILRAICCTAMALLILFDLLQVWMLFAFSLAFGLISGFAIPAGNSILPQVIAKDHLSNGNAIIMGGFQIISLAGPALAGGMIGLFTDAQTGLATAYGVDAATFAFSGLMIMLMRSGRGRATDDGGTPEKILKSIGAGLRYVGLDRPLLLLMVVSAGCNLFLVGPIFVGIPVLANLKFAEGAAAYGMLLSSFAGGSFIGISIAAATKKPSPAVMRVLFFLITGNISLTLALLGLLTSTWIAMAAMLILGVGLGYVNIIVISALQARTPDAMRGRIMGLVSFAGVGLIPVSEALSGLIASSDISTLFFSASISMALMVVWMLTRMDDLLKITHAAELSANQKP